MKRGFLLGIAIFIFSIAFFSFKAGDISLQFTGDENFYFESSRHMAEEGDWLTPKYYGKKRFQKPPLYYWMITASFKLFGTNWHSARLPSAAAGTLVVLLTFLIGTSLFGRQAGILSSVILATSLKFFKYTRAAIPDMTLLLFMTLAIYFFVKLREKENPGKTLSFLMFAALGLATLTKGPVGFILPMLAITSFVIISKERNLFKKMHITQGLVLYALIIAPWFIAMIKLHGSEYISHIMTRELSQRVIYFSETKKGLELFIEYLGSLFFYIPVVLVRFLPWSLFVPAALVTTFRGGKSEGGKNEYLFVASWFLSIFLFFSVLGEKHSQYILALSPALALLLGYYFTRRTRLKLIVPVVTAVIAALIFTLTFSYPVIKQNSAILAGFAASIKEAGMPENSLIGAGSHELIPQKLEVYLDKPVKRVCAKLYDQVENERLNKLFLKEFFEQKERVFCLIKKEDYLRFAGPSLREKLFVIDKDYLWKRKFSFKDRTFKDEYWLVTNKKN